MFIIILFGIQEGRTCAVPDTGVTRRSSSPVEHFFNCPYCGEEISMVLDLSVRRQTYVEDCEVCCNPIEITYAVEDDTLSSFAAKVLE
jgi:transcription elongation factor Elf1